MAIDASQLLGAAQIAGVKVNPRGMGQQVSRNQVGPLVSGISSKVVFHGATPATTGQTPDFGRNAFLAVTDSELALIKLKSGAVTLKLDEVLARVPRTQVASAGLLGGGVTPGLTVAFRDGGGWEVEITRPSKKHAEQVIHALNG